MAVIAAVIAFSSFILSFLTYWRNRWPTPSMEVTWDFGGDASIDLVTDSVRCVAKNRGRGDALDVRLEALRMDGTTWAYALGRANRLTFGEEVELWFNFMVYEPYGHDEIVLVNQSGGSRSVQGVPQDGTSRTANVRLTWHQAPRTKKGYVLEDNYTDRAR